MITVLANVLLGTPAPLGAFLMLYICCVTDIPPSLSLVAEKTEADLMLKPPRNPAKEYIVNVKLISGQAYFFMENLISVDW